MAYTLEQLQKMGAKPVTPASSGKSYTAQDLQKMGAKPTVVPAPVKKDSILGGLVTGIGSDAKKRIENVKADYAQGENGTGKITAPEVGFRAVGQLAGFAGDIIGQGFSAAGKALDKGSEKIPKSEKALQKEKEIADAKSKIINSKPVQNTLRYATDTYAKIPERLRKSVIEPAANIATLLPIGKGATVAKEAVEQGVKKQVGKEAVKIIAKDVVEKAPKTVVEKATKAFTAPIKFIGEKTGLSDKIAEGNVTPFLKTEFAADKVKTPIKKAAEQAKLEKNYNTYYEQSKKNLKDAYVKNPVDEFVVPKVVKAVETKVIPARRKAGAVMGEEMKKLGSTKIDISSKMQTLENDLKDRANLIFDNEKGKVISLTKQSKLDAADKKFVEDYVKEVNKLGANPTAADIEAFEARNRSKVNKAIQGGTIDKNAASIVKNHASSLLDEFNPKTNPAFKTYAEARTKYKELSNFLEEADGVLGDDSVLGNPTKLTSALKSAVQSIHSTGKKDWLIKLEQLTGEKGLQDSVTAFQAMQDAGDFKGRSLLDIFTKNEMGGRQVPLGKKGILQAATDAVLEKGKDIIAGTPNEQTLRYFKNQKTTISRPIKSQGGKIVEFPKRYSSKPAPKSNTFKATINPKGASKTQLKVNRYIKK